MPIDPINGYYYDPNNPDSLGERISLEGKYRETIKDNGKETVKMGYAIKARDVIMLDAPEVFLSPDTPLKTNAQDAAGAINELWALFEEGGEGDGGWLRNITDSGGSLRIRIAKIESEEQYDEETDEYKTITKDISYSDNNYTYDTKDFSETITITKTSIEPDGTTITETKSQTFTKTIITELRNSDDVVILKAECDEKGENIKYFDANGDRITLN